ncbi:MAG: hypothetical protein IKS99_02960 [Firmicutes bacterium]|nr:hypothetical protein [Bacillota bacterium]
MSKKIYLAAALIIVLTIVFFVMSLGQGETPPDGPGDDGEYTVYTFRNDRLLQEHFDKHGREMGFTSAEDYQKAASDVANNPNSLHKLEKEDNDDVYYLEETNEFVVVSRDGYIRTYFCPDSGKKYFDKQ